MPFPPSPFSNLLLHLQSRGHVDCSVVDVRTPCERVELDVVVDDLSAGVGCVHQVEALHLISALAEASGDPVPDNFGAVVDNVESGNGWDGWCVDHVLEIKLLAGKCDGAELEGDLARRRTTDKSRILTGSCSRDRIESEVSL